jgi:hypothetical protein
MAKGKGKGKKAVAAVSDLENKSTDELIAIINEQASTIEAGKKEIAEKEAVITELIDVNGKTAASVSVSDDGSSVEVDGVKYLIKLKSFIHAGKKYTAGDVAADGKLAKALIDKKSPALVKA